MYIFLSFLQDTIEFIKYEVLLQPKPPRDNALINSVPRQLTIKVRKGENGYTLLFPDLPGMVLYSEKVDKINVIEVINEGLSAYFDIPRYYAKNLKFITVFKDENGKVLASLPTGNDNLLKAYK